MELATRGRLRGQLQVAKEVVGVVADRESHDRVVRLAAKRRNPRGQDDLDVVVVDLRADALEEDALRNVVAFPEDCVVPAAREELLAAPDALAFSDRGKPAGSAVFDDGEVAVADAFPIRDEHATL